MNEFPQYLQTRRPFSWWLEEVTNFMKPCKMLHGRSPLQHVVKRARHEAYAVLAVKSNHGDWVKMEKERLFVVGCHRDAGHEAGAQFIMNFFLESQRTRRVNPPRELWEVVPLLEWVEPLQSPAMQDMQEWNPLFRCCSFCSLLSVLSSNAMFCFASSHGLSCVLFLICGGFVLRFALMRQERRNTFNSGAA